MNITLINLILISSILILILLLGTFGSLLYVSRASRKRAVEQDRILADNAELAKEGKWFRVRLASEARFKKFWKLFPYEASGILFVTREGIFLEIIDLDGQLQKIKFIPANSRVAWIGSVVLPNGAICWLSLESQGERFYISSETGTTILNTKTSTRDIYNQLKQVHEELETDSEAETKYSSAEFALEQNRFSLITLIIMVIIFGFILIDVFINMESFVSRPSVLYSLLLAIAVTPLAFVTLAAGKVPVRESSVLAVLLGIAFAVALPSGLLRLNQLTDGDGLKVYSYRLNESLRLEPIQQEHGLPMLDIRKTREYWQSFETGSIHEFELRKGGLGFYQINMAPFYEKTRRFYRDNNQ